MREWEIETAPLFFDLHQKEIGHPYDGAANFSLSHYLIFSISSHHFAVADIESGLQRSLDFPAL